MKEETILQILKIMPLGTAIIVIVLFLSLMRLHPEKRILRMYDEFTGMLKEKSRKSSWYHRQSGWLLKKGASFHFGSKITPLKFLAIRMIGAMIGLVIGTQFAFGYGLVGAFGLWFLPEILLEHYNRSDNEKMLGDIKLVYHTLSMQIRAGIHVTDALGECYSGVQNDRLYKALLDLAGDIVMKSDVFRALESFQAKFDNRYVDSLCITVLQAMESGQAVELLSDIAEQIKDMEGAVLEKKRNSLDRSLTFYQLGILAAVLCVALYTCVSYMFSEAVGI